MKVSVTIEYEDIKIEDKALYANAKKLWSKAGRKIRDIYDIKLYVKPEEASVYCVINDEPFESFPFGNE